MLIVWGKRRMTKRLGYIAEFCPFCRGVRAHRVTAWFTVRHINMIPTGRRTETHQIRRCTGCQRTVRLEPGSYTTGVRRFDGDMESLIVQTNPHIRRMLADRLALEERARHTPERLSSEEHEWLLAEPFAELANDVQRWSGRLKPIETPAALCLVGATIAGVVLFIIMSLDDNPGPPMPPAGIVCIVLGVLLLVCGVCLMETGRRRFLGRCVLPFVGRSLAPLKPTREEIESTLHALAARGWAIGTLLTTSDVFAAVRTARPPTTWADTGPQGLAPRRPS